MGTSLRESPVKEDFMASVQTRPDFMASRKSQNKFYERSGGFQRGTKENNFFEEEELKEGDQRLMNEEEERVTIDELIPG